MKTKCKRLLALLGVAVMLVGQCGSVLAEEGTQATESVEAIELEETADDSGVAEASETGESGSDEESTVEILAPSGAQWSSTEVGRIEFTNPNQGGVYLAYLIQLFKDGSLINQSFSSMNTPLTAYDFSHFIMESGDYTVRIAIFPDNYGYDEAVAAADTWQYSTTSPVLAYECSQNVLPVPEISVTTAGLVTWEEIENEYLSSIRISLYEIVDGGYIAVYAQTCDGTSIDLGEYLTNGKEYSIGVQTMSSDLSAWAHSADVKSEIFVAEVPDSGESDSGSSGGESGSGDSEDGTGSSSGSEEEVEILAPTNVRWNGSNIFIDFNNPNTEPVWMMLDLYCGDERVLGAFGHSGEGSDFSSMQVSDAMEETGDYYAKVIFMPGDLSISEFLNTYKDSEYTATSEVFHYTNPGRLDTPEVTFSSTGIVSWNAVGDGVTYRASLYEIVDGIEAYVWSYFGIDTSTDFLEHIATGKQYGVRVKVFSPDIFQWGHSYESDLILLSNAGIEDSVNSTLTDSVGNLSDESSAEDVQSAVTDVKTAFADTAEKRELQYAMQTSSETQAQMQKLETLYEEAMGVSTVTSVAEDVAIDASKVSIVGASLNATQQGSVSFAITSTTNEVLEEILGDEELSKVISFSMDLSGAGVEAGAELAIPVTITMPAPNGINPNYVIVRHYSADGTYEEMKGRNNGDGTVSFTITHFSEFVFYEGEIPSAPTSTVTSSTANTSKVWTPTTEDEKERYSYFSRDKVSYIVGTEGGYKAEMIHEMQGRLFFNSVYAAIGDYKIARTYNVKIDGKLIYETAAPAMFVLDIPKEYLVKDRDYKMICVSKNGEVHILDDLDMDENTITFLTNKFYAFALIYK